MNKTIVLGILGILLLSISSAVFAQDEKINEQKIMSDMVAQQAGVKVVSFEKRNVVDDIYEYTWTLKVGKGLFDVIGVHRVVKEKKPWQPIRTKDAVMMIHGDAVNFRTSFLGSKESDEVPDEQAPAVYLAKENIDVWGIDRRGTFIPDGYCHLTGCSFMRGWNTETHINDVRIAIKFASLVRKLTKEPNEKMFLLGHSRGAQIAYAYANKEATLPEKKQTLKGLLPGDVVYEFAPNATVFYCVNYSDPTTCGEINAREAATTRYQVLKAQYNSGKYYRDEGFNMKIIGFLADNFPNDPSPLDANFTNWQMAMTVVAATYVTFLPPTVPYVSFYHYAAGTVDQNGIPNGLQFTNANFTVDLACKVPPYQALGEAIDGEALMAGLDSPYDDHLGQIGLPVYYWGAGGGMGPEATYTLSLLGSKDVTVNIVSIMPERPFDFAHADLLWATNAKDLIWEPMASWIKKH